MSEREQRRLAAILAADIAGYSALMGADEEPTVHDLKAHQAVVLPTIGNHGGRIIDTAGDGMVRRREESVSASMYRLVGASPPEFPKAGIVR
jgi:class 3 adenylate cyclase